MAKPSQKSGDKSGARRLIVGISGASGVSLGVRLLEALSELGVESHLVVSKAAEMTIGYETALKPKEVAARASYAYAAGDIGAPIASGSFRTDGMIVVPCSVRSMSEIATGVTTTLLSRAADVTLKERRPLVLVVRESPLHLGHLRSLVQLSEIGAVILPPVPAYYAAPHSLTDMADQMVGRMLDVFGYDWPKVRRWGEDLAQGRRKPKIKPRQGQT